MGTTEKSHLKFIAEKEPKFHSRRRDIGDFDHLKASRPSKQDRTVCELPKEKKVYGVFIEGIW